MKNTYLIKKIKNNFRLIKYKINKNLSYEQIEKKVSRTYSHVHMHRLSYDQPTLYSEKVCYSKLYNMKTKLYSELADKLLVRNYISDKLGDEFLIPLVGVYDNMDDILIENLPQQFVIKCNHDSGSVKVVKNKENIKNEWKNICDEYNNFFLKRNYAYTSFEMQYLNIKPKIMIEKYMGDLLKDYKFLCFNGEPRYVWVDFDRFSNHTRNIYDLNWNLQNFSLGNYNNYKGKVTISKSYKKMLEIAKTLCKGFDHVRIDLYDIDGNVYFGEMTFTYGSGLQPIVPKEWDKRLGNFWKQDTSNRDKINRKDKPLKI